MTLLSEGYQPRVLWQDTATPHPVATAELPGAVDVVVVGGGYAGLSAAAELSRRGRSVALLDAHDLGWGASTRNGGMVLPGAEGRPAHARAPPRRARPAPPPGGGGRLRPRRGAGRGGHRLRLPADRAAVPHPLRRRRRPPRGARRGAACRSGRPAHVVRGDDLAAEIGSTLFAAGLVVERSGGIHPARFHAGLVAPRRGTDAVAAPAHPGDRRRAAAATAGRSARHAVRSTRATSSSPPTPTPTRWCRRSAGGCCPMGSYIIATEPLEPALGQGGAPDRPDVLQRPEPPLVLAARRRGAHGVRRPQAARRRVARRGPRLPLRVDARRRTRSSPASRVERAWGGNVALTLDRLPHCGRLDGLWYATGCNGSGVALNTWLGHRMAGAPVRRAAARVRGAGAPPDPPARAAPSVAARGVGVVPVPGQERLMRILVVGSGGVGSAFAMIARRRDFFEEVVLADLDEARARDRGREDRRPALHGHRDRRVRSRRGGRVRSRPRRHPRPERRRPALRHADLRRRVRRRRRPTSTWRCRCRRPIPSDRTRSRA